MLLIAIATLKLYKHWSRVRFTPLFPGDNRFLTGTVISIQIVFDEGVDAGPDFSGFANIDNIDINGTLVTRQ